MHGGNFIKCFLCTNLGVHVVFLFILFMWWTTLINLKNIKSTLYCWNKHYIPLVNYISLHLNCSYFFQTFVCAFTRGIVYNIWFCNFIDRFGTCSYVNIITRDTPFFFLFLFLRRVDISLAWFLISIFKRIPWLSYFRLNFSLWKDFYLWIKWLTDAGI